ncbi:hypothetical protein FYK55_17285 [Roseiconus nitratireducens]|uniref:Uncharacterized protein n=1 Tax=Roseiconus nitratireducens TaxID=2605748 RepID=A0A5M6D410_9BACT|nr:hypothetical protein [Roseiconus nitratireducens]KAA5541330.1 hypothetical protein FYK55_17285 [Roseiconus nitratireducens]
MKGVYRLHWIAVLLAASGISQTASGQELVPAIVEDSAAVQSDRTLAEATPIEIDGGQTSTAPISGEWGYTPSEEFVIPPLESSDPIVSSEADSAVASQPSAPHVATSCRCQEAGHASCRGDCHRLLDPSRYRRDPCSFRPFGDAVQSAFGAQIANGQADRTVLYQYDFIQGTASLNRRGFVELVEIAERLMETPLQMVIETTGNLELDAARRANVLGYLAEMPYPIGPERVITAIPQVPSLDGIDAILTHQRLLQLAPLGNDAGGGSVITGLPIFGDTQP